MDLNKDSGNEIVTKEHHQYRVTVDKSWTWLQMGEYVKQFTWIWL